MDVMDPWAKLWLTGAPMPRPTPPRSSRKARDTFLGSSTDLPQRHSDFLLTTTPCKLSLMIWCRSGRTRLKLSISALVSVMQSLSKQTKCLATIGSAQICSLAALTWTHLETQLQLLSGDMKVKMRRLSLLPPRKIRCQRLAFLASMSHTQVSCLLSLVSRQCRRTSVKPHADTAKGNVNQNPENLATIDQDIFEATRKSFPASETVSCH